MRRSACLLALATLMAACGSSGGDVRAPRVRAHSEAATPATVGSSSWLTYHHDERRTGVDPTSPSLGSFRHAWTSPLLDGAVYAEPLIRGSRVYVATENDSVYALSASTGHVVWRR